ncbi:hypothetical protein ACIODS_16870 [Micromonospora chalcea]|uniref:hypothetical protein n=1 Tax=Micromonospora TaxID=1873 RepID=UPI0011C35137|nr:MULTISPECIES: hypothetical protein [Micromonospora]MBC8989594.1 hypothetical protein [Micromonospora chalcea]
MTTRKTESAGWPLARELARDLWCELRAGPQPLPVLYLACDGCGQVTAHTRVQKVMSISDGTLTTSPPEAVCEACEHAQPRAIGDELPADTTVICTGHRFRRLGFRRRRTECGEAFAVPVAAVLVVCPWCVPGRSGLVAARGRRRSDDDLFKAGVKHLVRVGAGVTDGSAYVSATTRSGTAGASCRICRYRFLLSIVADGYGAMSGCNRGALGEVS